MFIASVRDSKERGGLISCRADGSITVIFLERNLETLQMCKDVYLCSRVCAQLPKALASTPAPPKRCPEIVN